MMKARDYRSSLVLFILSRTDLFADELEKVPLHTLSRFAKWLGK